MAYKKLKTVHTVMTGCLYFSGVSPLGAVAEGQSSKSVWFDLPDLRHWDWLGDSLGRFG